VELFAAAFEVGEFGGGEFGEVGVGGGGVGGVVFDEVAGLGDFAFGFLKCGVVVDEGFEFLLLAGDFGGFARVLLEGRVGDLRIEFVEAVFEWRDVGKFRHGKYLMAAKKRKRRKETKPF
jgi:hypothetical protein